MEAGKNGNGSEPERSRDFGLSRHEHRVLLLMTEGVVSDEEIAGALGMSRLTVNNHVKAIMRKLKAASRTEAAIRALKVRLFA